MRVTELASSRAVLPSPAEAGHPTSPGACRGMRERTKSERWLLYLRARLVVKRHYARPLTLAAVAKALATSPRQLQRAYEQFGDRSFRENLRDRRMEVAAELLATPAIPSVRWLGWLAIATRLISRRRSAAPMGSRRLAFAWRSRLAKLSLDRGHPSPEHTPSVATTLAAPSELALGCG
jgi:AraC-like DNA-binding protein